MAVPKYQYETSPRKMQPQRGTKRQRKQNTLKLVEEQRENIKITKEEYNKRVKIIGIVILAFAMLLVISLRNSKINESFSDIKTMETNLALLDKENEQARVSIENGLNLNNIEKQAKENLGMQKIMTSQTKYISLDKKDYIAPVADDFIVEEESVFKKMMDIIGNMF